MDENPYRSPSAGAASEKDAEKNLATKPKANIALTVIVGIAGGILITLALISAATWLGLVRHPKN